MEAGLVSKGLAGRFWILDTRCWIFGIEYPAPKRKENSIMKARSWIKQCKTLVKWKSIVVVTLLFAMLLALTSCAVAPRRRRGRAVMVANPGGNVDVVYVQKAPPKLKVETRPKKPNPKAVWVGGHWQWRRGKHVWVSGHWDRNPSGKAWMPGHWDKRARGWIWVPGHWQ